MGADLVVTAVCRVIYLVYFVVTVLAVVQNGFMFLPHTTEMTETQLLFPPRVCFPLPANATMAADCPNEVCRHGGAGSLLKHGCVGSFVYIASSLCLIFAALTMAAFAAADLRSRYGRGASRAMVSGMGLVLAVVFLQAALATICAARETTDFLIAARAAWAGDAREPTVIEKPGAGVLWAAVGLSVIASFLTLADAIKIGRLANASERPSRIEKGSRPAEVAPLDKL